MLYEVITVDSGLSIRLKKDTEEIFKEKIFPLMIELQKRILDCLDAVENISYNFV